MANAGVAVAVAVALAVAGYMMAGIDTTIQTRTMLKGGPPSLVWAVLYDMDDWRSWNDVFDIGLEGLPEKGKDIKITCKWSNGAVDVANERIVAVEEATKLCWSYQDLPDWLLKTDRCIVLTPTKIGTTLVHNYGIFAGPLAPFVILYRGALVKKGFMDFDKALAARVDKERFDVVDGGLAADLEGVMQMPTAAGRLPL